MSKPTHVFVTAAQGRLCPIAARDATGPGGTLLIVKPGDVHRLPYSSFVRRRLAAGDLVVVPDPELPAPPAASDLTASKEG